MRRLVDSNIVGIAIWHADGRILDINNLFLNLIDYNREDFASGRVRWTDFAPPEWREPDAQVLERIHMGGAAQTHEREYEDRPRQLLIRTTSEGSGIVRLDLQDAGTGLDPVLADNLFEPFYTAKPDGMGLDYRPSQRPAVGHAQRGTRFDIFVFVTPGDG